MANPEHLAKLNEGVNVWNEWRETTRKTPRGRLRPGQGPATVIAAQGIGARRPQVNFSLPTPGPVDLSGANLGLSNFSGANLSRADLRGSNLTGANLNHADLGLSKLMGANLRRADLKMADLSRADLSEADLRHADLSGARVFAARLTGARLHAADLSGANLGVADLVLADLRAADLSRVRLSQAFLTETNFSEANLTSADFTGAIIVNTIFGNTNLTEAKGLDSCHHLGPSVLDYATLTRSGMLPLPFLRGCGLPENYIENLPSLLKRVIQFYSCFISYSTKDQEFADRLHVDLQKKGVRCWFAPEDLKIGDHFRNKIDESIRLHDKLLIILSENSIQST